MRSRVIYIGGSMRSGTTLVGDLLGQVPGVVHVGELANIWDHGLRNNFGCGCGAPFRDCPFWSDIIAAAFGDPPEVDHERLLRTALHWSRTRTLLRLLTPGGRVRARDELAEHTEAMARLYRTIVDRRGARVIVDSSKRPLLAWAAAQHPQIDLSLLYLTRDPRAVAYSRRRLKFNPDKQRNMGGRGPVSTSVAWVSRYSVAAAFWERGGGSPGDYLKVRYEDFAAAPRAHLEQILGWVGEDPARAKDIIGDDGSYLATPGHTIAGNPIRFKSGRVVVRLDGRWRREASAWDNFVVSALTSPVLGKNGYPLRPASPDG